MKTAGFDCPACGIFHHGDAPGCTFTGAIVLEVARSGLVASLKIAGRCSQCAEVPCHHQKLLGAKLLLALAEQLDELEPLR